MRTVKESDRTVADHGGQTGIPGQPGGVCFFQLKIVKNPAGGTVGIDRDAAVAGQRMFLQYNGITAVRGDKIRAVPDKGFGGLIGIRCDNDLVLHDRDKIRICNIAVLVQAVEYAAVLRQIRNITRRIRGIQCLAVHRCARLRVDDQQSDIAMGIGIGAVRAVRIIEDIKAVLCAERERAAAGVFLPRGQNLTAEGIAGIPDGVSIDPCLGRCAGTDDRFSRGIGGISVILCLFGIDGNGAVGHSLCQCSKRASEQRKHGQDGQQHRQYTVLYGFGQTQNAFPDRVRAEPRDRAARLRNGVKDDVRIADAQVIIELCGNGFIAGKLGILCRQLCRRPDQRMPPEHAYRRRPAECPERISVAQMCVFMNEHERRQRPLRAVLCQIDRRRKSRQARRAAVIRPIDACSADIAQIGAVFVQAPLKMACR